MATIINADTSNGLKLTSDTSGELKLQSAGVDIATVNSSGITMASGKTIAGNVGKVLQVVSTTKTDTFSTSTTGFTDITGLSVSITPTSSSSKILVMWNIDFGNASPLYGVVFRMVRDATPISIGDQVGVNRNRSTSAMFTVYSNTNNTTQNRSGTYLDSPSTTSSITYKAQGSITASTYYVNRTGEYNDGNYEGTGTSTITVMEIAG